MLMSTPVPRLRPLAVRALEFLIISAAIWVVLMVASRLRVVLVPLALAVMVAAVLDRPRRFLIAHGWPPLGATWTLFFLGTALIVGAGWVTIPPIVNEASSLGNLATSGVDKVQAWLSKGHFGLSPAELQTYLTDLRSSITSGTTSIVGRVLGGATLAGEFALGGLLTAVLTFFFLQDGPDMARAISGRAGERAAAIENLIDRIRTALAKYVAASAVNGIVNAFLTGGLLLLLGVPLVLPLAALTFFSTFFPLVGAVVVGVLAGLVALAAKGVSTALIVILGIVVIHNAEGYVISPLIFRGRLEINGIAIVLALTAGTVVAGLAGALLAVPLLAVTMEVVGWSREQWRAQQPSGDDGQAGHDLDPDV